MRSKADICALRSIKHFGLIADIGPILSGFQAEPRPQSSALWDKAGFRCKRTNVRFGETFDKRSFLEGLGTL